MEYVWDPDKAEKNLRKHKIDFETAVKVFDDPYYMEYDQEDDDDGLRYNAIGLVDGRMLHVTFTTRGNVHRIISARAAERHERRLYHEG